MKCVHLFIVKNIHTRTKTILKSTMISTHSSGADEAYTFVQHQLEVGPSRLWGLSPNSRSSEAFTILRNGTSPNGPMWMLLPLTRRRMSYSESQMGSNRCVSGLIDVDWQRVSLISFS